MAAIFHGNRRSAFRAVTRPGFRSTTVELRGDIDDDAVIDLSEALVDAIRAEPCPMQVLVAMRDVDSVSGAAVDALDHASRLCDAQHTELTLMHPRRAVRQALEDGGLGRLIAALE